MTGVVSGPDPGGDGDVVDAASLKDLGGGVSEVGADDDCFFFCGWGALHNFVMWISGATPPYIGEVVKCVTRMSKWSNGVTRIVGLRFVGLRFVGLRFVGLSRSERLSQSERLS